MCRRLERRYRSPTHGNKADPTDELVYILLSQMTTAPSFGRVFDRLKAVTGEWSALLAMRERKLKSAIADAGLSTQKARHLKAIALKLHSDFGQVTLEPLHAMTDDAAEDYLTSLPGVGVKTAKCVLMYSFGRRVLPVDTHVERVARRLGLVPRKTRGGTKIHAHLESVVAPRLRYSFHVNAVALGRDTCRAVQPKCGACVLQEVCPKRKP